jgi:FkbH-like protein
MNALFSELAWLPRPPQDYSERLKSLGMTDGLRGTDIQALAVHALDLNQLTKLAKVIERARRSGAGLEPLVPFKLAILSNSTTDLIGPALIASAARHGVDLEVVRPPYDQVAQEALSAESIVNRARPDAVLFALDYRALPLASCWGDAEASADVVERTIGYLGSLRDGIKRHSGAVCIFQTFAPPAESLFGSLDGALSGTKRNLLARVNLELVERVAEWREVSMDVSSLAATLGLADWHDPALWNLGKFAFSDRLVPLYAEHVARLVAALRGRARKALVLDLDNTLWGGVVGDDGLEGIRIGQGDPVGEAHLGLQRLALELRDRGIVLAVSSKNTDAIARAPFERHPDMLIKLEHIAIFQANWNDKAANIRAIAEELSLGLDALVFMDDNPAERGLVRRLLPQVAVPELPEDPACYARTLAAAGYFESVSFTPDDKNRAAQYQDNARRARLLNQSGDIGSYLASLQMTIEFRPFDATGRARIVQLINKSNQFNLTTRRYTEPEIAAAERDPNVFTLQVRLRDTFGDNGMISVIICRQADAKSWDIDTWLMSCRVLGREVEPMVLREILHHAREAGAQTLIGRFRPTDRNKLVEDHYAKLGFALCARLDSGETRWELDVASTDPPVGPMTVVRQGFDAPSFDLALDDTAANS